MEWTPRSLTGTIKEFGALVSHGCCVMKRNGRASRRPKIAAAPLNRPRAGHRRAPADDPPPRVERLDPPGAVTQAVSVFQSTFASKAAAAW